MAFRRVPFAELNPGALLSEDIFAPGKRGGTPLFSHDLRLSAHAIAQIRSRFTDRESLLVIEEGEAGGAGLRGLVRRSESSAEASTALSMVDLAALQREDLDKTTVLAVVQPLFERLEFRQTATSLREHHTNAAKLMGSLIETGTVDEKATLKLANQVTHRLVVDKEHIDPSLLFMVQLKDWDPSTFDHSADVALFTVLVASRIADDFAEQASLFTGGLLHDIGKFIYAKL